MVKNFQELIAAVQDKPKKKIAIVSPEGTTSLELVKLALAQGIAQFVLVGNAAKITGMCNDAGLEVSQVEIVQADGHKAAAEEAVRLVTIGSANAVMKGNLPTATFMRAILDKQKGLNNNKVISEITLFEKVEGGEEGFRYLTDCAINVAPTLDEKKQIIENAVELAHKLGNPLPKVAVLSAVEVVNSAMPDTLEAAALSKMADRGQITGCLVDGPLAFDNAVSPEAAKYKNLGSEVAGNADILLAQNLLCANPLRKCFVYYSKQRIATALMGAKAPVIITSRSDSADTMLLTLAIAAYIS